MWVVMLAARAVGRGARQQVTGGAQRATRS